MYGRLRNKLSQLILIILDSGWNPSHLFRTRFERREMPGLSAKQGSIWYHFNVFGMTRSGIKPTTTRSRGERSHHRVTTILIHNNTFRAYLQGNATALVRCTASSKRASGASRATLRRSKGPYGAGTASSIRIVIKKQNCKFWVK